MVPYWFITQAKANHIKQDHLTVLLLQTSKHLSLQKITFYNNTIDLSNTHAMLFSHTQQIVTHGLITSLCLALYFDIITYYMYWNSYFAVLDSM